MPNLKEPLGYWETAFDRKKARDGKVLIPERGIAGKVIERAEVAAREWEHTSRLKESLERAKMGCYIPLGVLSDVASLLGGKEEVEERGVEILLRAIEAL